MKKHIQPKEFETSNYYDIFFAKPRKEATHLERKIKKSGHTKRFTKYKEFITS